MQSSLGHCHHVPTQVSSLFRSPPEGEALNALEPTAVPRETFYFPWELHRHPWVKGGLCLTLEYNLEDLATVTWRSLSSVLYSPGTGQCLSTGWVGCSRPVLPAQSSFSPVWFPGLKP